MPFDSPTCAEVLEHSSSELAGMKGRLLDVLTVSRPDTIESAKNLAKVISKLSPLLGNMIEFATVEHLNDYKSWQKHGRWKRQDPGFPDTIFVGKVKPTPGIEIKTWFPLATEITARFKDSQSHFQNEQTNVAMLAWLPEHLIFGKPKIIDVWIDSASSVAQARDKHYHRPPTYLVFEPGDTAARTINLRQTNTNGYRLQNESLAELAEAQELVASWGPSGLVYSPSAEYQSLLRTLLTRFTYRLDTNYAKMDRIEHPGLEIFKTKVLSLVIDGHSVAEWATLLTAQARAINAMEKAQLKLDEALTDIEPDMHEIDILQRRVDNTIQRSDRATAEIEPILTEIIGRKA